MKGMKNGAFPKLLALFRAHLDKENQTVAPLLGYLLNRQEGHEQVDAAALKMANSKLGALYKELMDEHAEIKELLGKVNEVQMDDQRVAADSLVRELLHHIRLEEEIIYPAALAARELIESGR